MRATLPSLLGILLSLTLPEASHAVPILPLSEVRVGQRVEVRTVLRGDSIETFAAEVIGVLPGGRAGGDVILARVTTPEVAHLGVAQGMSGSPVTAGGRLLGALSSGWGFSKDPIFGITPAAEMLRVLELPESPRVEGTAGPVGVDPLPGPAPRFRGFRWDDAPQADPPLQPGAAPALGSAAQPLALPLMTRGLAPALLEPMREWFAARGLGVQPGGAGRGLPARSPAPPAIVPGSSVSVDILRGDLELSAIGTVTIVEGDRVLLFGHPFFQSGEVRLPLSTAPITMVMPSLNTSFKLGVPGVPVGTVTQDRRAAVAGRLGPVPRLMPFRVVIERPGEPVHHFQFASVEDRTLLPQLVSTATVNSLLESGGSAPQQSVRWRMSAWRAGQVLRVGDVTAGDAPLADMLSAFLAPVRFLYANPFERLRLDSLTVHIEVTPGRGQAFLRAAALRSAAVRPGGALAVDVEIERWRGSRERRTLELTVPAGLAPGRYQLWLGGGFETDRIVATRLPARFRPVSLADAWARLGAVRSSDALHSALWARAAEVASGGHDYPELPTSALALLAPAQVAGDHARRGEWALLEERRHPVDGVLRGELLLEVVVDPEAPR